MAEELEQNPTTDPPMADPGTTPELMNQEQKRAFNLKERARILHLSTNLKLEEAHRRNLISDADLMAMRLQDREQLLTPQAVIDAPEGATVKTEKRCCN